MLDLERDVMFGWGTGQIDFTVMLGLPFMKHLWKLEQMSQLVIMKVGHRDRVWPTVPTLFEVPGLRGKRTTGEASLGATGSNEGSNDRIKSLARPNSAWTWAEGSDAISFGKEDFRVREVQSLGLVFWDEARLIKSGLFDRTLL